jgi:hypothetical protein
MCLVFRRLKNVCSKSSQLMATFLSRVYQDRELLLDKNHLLNHRAEHLLPLYKCVILVSYGILFLSIIWKNWI